MYFNKLAYVFKFMRRELLDGQIQAEAEREREKEKGMDKEMDKKQGENSKEELY